VGGGPDAPRRVGSGLPDACEFPTLKEMYRDIANSLDEHDRAVGAILIG
jgi:hypothetical protein